MEFSSSSAFGQLQSDILLRLSVWEEKNMIAKMNLLIKSVLNMQHVIIKLLGFTIV